MSWSYKAKWPLKKSDELSSEHFEDLRKHIWSADSAYYWFKYAYGFNPDSGERTGDGPGWLLPAEWSETFTQSYSEDYQQYWCGYIVGDLVSYNGEIWICASQQPAYRQTVSPYNWVGKNSRPSKFNSSWQLGAHPLYYQHFAANSGRYASAGYGRQSRMILPASAWLPKHTRREKQQYGPVAYENFRLWFKDNIVTYQDNYYKCTRTHLAGQAFDSSKWQKISKSRAQNPNNIHNPVEISWDHITGAIGALYPWPNRNSGPTPWYYNYYLGPENQPAEAGWKYGNEKMSEAYQARAELTCSRGWCWFGPPGGLQPNDEINWLGHQLGMGKDPSGHFYGENAKGNMGFNKSAFEEILHLYGRYDWYLDLVVPPAVGTDDPRYNVLGCWRRTWKYSQNYPGYVGQTCLWYDLQCSEQPKDGSHFWIGNYQFRISSDYNELNWTDKYCQVPLGWMWMGFNIPSWLQTYLIPAIEFAQISAQAQQFAPEGSEIADHVSLSTPLNQPLKLGPGCGLKIVRKDSYGGVTLMWPQEWGYPPEPSVSWRDYYSVAKLINQVNERWKANPAMMALMEERHTGVARPGHDGWKPELFCDILNDIKGVLAFLKYTTESINILASGSYWSSTPSSTMRHSKNFGDWTKSFPGSGKWVDLDMGNYITWIPGNYTVYNSHSPDPDSSWGSIAGYRAMIGRVTIENDDYWSPDTSTQWWNEETQQLEFGYVPNFSAARVRIAARASELLMRRYIGQRKLILGVNFYPFDYIHCINRCWFWQENQYTYMGQPVGATLNLPGIHTNVGGCATNKLPSPQRVGTIEVPILVDTSAPEAGNVYITPEFNVGFFTPASLENGGFAGCCDVAVVPSLAGQGYCPLIDINPMELNIGEKVDESD